MRAEVWNPTRSAPLRRVVGTIGGRRLWHCDARSGAPDPGWPQPLGRASARTTTGARRRVLVVDDEASIRLLCRVNLSASGMDVLEAADGEEGLELARKERPDLVLLDVMMPGIDGWSVARELGSDERTREIPVVFLTARAEAADRRIGAQLGGVGYVVKPFDPVGIGDFVEEVLERIERGDRERLRRDVSSPES